MLVQTVDTDRDMATHRFQDFTSLQSRQNSVVQLNLDGIVCITGANVPPSSYSDVKNMTSLLAKPWIGHTILLRTHLTMQMFSISISCQRLWRILVWAVDTIAMARQLSKGDESHRVYLWPMNFCMVLSLSKEKSDDFYQQASLMAVLSA